MMRTRALPPGLQRPRRRRVAAPGQHLLRRRAEGDPDRIEHVDGGEQLRRPGHPGAEHQIGLAHPAGDFGLDIGVVEVLAGPIDGRLRVVGGGASLRLGRLGVVQILLRHRVFGEQRTEARHGAGGVVELRLRLRETGLRATQCSGVSGGIDLEEHLAGLDRGTFSDRLRDDDAGHRRAHLDSPHGLHLPGKLHRFADALRFRLDDRHRWRRKGKRRRLAAAHRQHQREHQERARYHSVAQDAHGNLEREETVDFAAQGNHDQI